MSKRFSLALPSQQQNTVVVHQGTLWIRGCMVKTWKKLPVELISDGLSVKFHKNGLLKMTYRLTATTTLTESDIRPFAFKLNNDKMELYIADESSEGKEIWKEHILDVIEQLQASQGNINADIAQAMKAVQKMNRPKLLVKIIGARNLLAKDNTGTSDPYVKVSLGSSIVRTSTIQKNLHPEWGMVFPFDWDVSMRYLYVEVWDEDFVTADDFLGCVNISILALKEGDIFRKWYPLCKRSDRSHVGGEIEIEIACIRQPDNSNHLLQLFQDIQNMPEFSLSIAACENGSGQVKVRDGPFGALLNANANASADDYNESDEQHQLSVTGFPLIFPSNEIEYLEDLSLNVSLVTMLDAEKISEAGILLLTNFRLIFISLNRIMKTDGSIERSSSADASRGAVGALSKHASILDPKSFDVTDLSIDLSLASIVKIENCSNEKSVEYGKIDVLTLHYIDQRKIQFIFKDFAHTRAKVYEIMKKDKASMFRGEFSLGSRFLELLNSPDAVSYEGPRPFKRFLRRIQQTVSKLIFA